MADQLITFDYEQCPTIRAFSLSEARIRGLMGPVGSGKSSGCAIEVGLRGMQQQPDNDGIRRTRFVVIRNTYGQLEDTTIKTFMQWWPVDGFGEYLSSKHIYTINKLPGIEIEVLFRALDRPDHVRNLLSLELTGAWVNEAREIPFSIIRSLNERIGRYPSRANGPGATWRGIFMDTNPPDEDSEWFDFFENNRPANAAIFKQPSGLSPEAENLPNLDPDYYQQAAMVRTPDEAKVYIHGQYGFVIDGKPVYPDYNDATHIAEDLQPIKGVPILRGWDFGLSPACILTQQTPSGQFLVFDEIVGADMGADKISDDVLAHCGQQYPDFEFRDYGDPAGVQRSQADEKTCFDILRGKGIAINPAMSQSLELRLGSVRKALTTMVNGKPVMRLHPRCRKIRKGFMGGYRFRRMQTSAERYSDVPDKNEYSHPHDALQYAASHVFGGILKNAGKTKINYDRLYS